MTIEVTQSAQYQHLKTNLTTKDVPLRKGPPTREELLVYYPAKFTWEQLKTFVNSGSVFLPSDHLLNLSFVRDLGLLKRDKRLQQRYNEWSIGIIEYYGSIGGSILVSG